MLELVWHCEPLAALLCQAAFTGGKHLVLCRKEYLTCLGFFQCSELLAHEAYLYAFRQLVYTLGQKI